MLTGRASAAARKAIGYLSDLACDGTWHDYDDAPMGPSDEWVTAYTAGALATYATVDSQAGVAARRAAARLRVQRTYSQGFGYSAHTGADADSTAHVLLLERKLLIESEPGDIRFLRAHFRRNGGCATYLRADAWGVSHIDVTPVAYLALPPEYRREVRPAFQAFVRQCRTADGTWPAYWWRHHHYSSYWNLRAAGSPSAEPIHAERRGAEPESAFDCAFVLGRASLERRDVRRPMDALLERQLADGSWPAAANLRVTHPQCYRPWETSSGPLCTDVHKTITTASALTALAHFLPLDIPWELP